MKKPALEIVTGASLAFLLVACDGDIQKAGLSPLETPDRTLTCYDYNGNTMLREKPTRSISFDNEGYVEGNYAGGRKSTYVTGGAGCIDDTIYFDTKSQDNANPYKDITDRVPYTVIVTNGMDRILLADKFTGVSNSYGGTTRLKLEVNGTTLREVYVQNGLTVIATENREGIDPAIIEGIKNGPKP